jgi:hypothetical protein
MPDKPTTPDIDTRIELCPVCLEAKYPERDNVKDDFVKRGGIFTAGACKKCQELIDNGNIALIGIQDGQGNEKHPARTGQLVFFNKDELTKWINDEDIDLEKDKVLFIDDSVLKFLTGENNNVDEQEKPE